MTAEPGRASARQDRLELDSGDGGCEVETGLALHADRLQRIGITRAADQKVAAEADADRRAGADAAIGAGEFAALKPTGRRTDGPGKSGLLGDAEIQSKAADGRDIGFRRTA